MLSFISRHKIFSTCAAALMLIFICAVGVIFYDAPALDDSDLLLPTPPAVAKEDNAAVLLSKLPSMIDYDSVLVSFGKTYQENPEGLEPAFNASRNAECRQAYLDKNQRALVILKEAIAKPYIMFGPEWPVDPKYDHEIPGTVTINTHLEFLYCLHWYDVPNDFLDDAIRWLKFCRRYATGLYSGSEDFITGTSMGRYSLRHISNCARYLPSSALCRSMIAGLQSYNLTHEDYIQCIKLSYTLFDPQQWIFLLTDYDSLEQKILPRRYSFKENCTKRFLQNIVTETVESVRTDQTQLDGKTYLWARPQFVSLDLDPVYSRFQPNILGTKIAAVFAHKMEYMHIQYLKLNTEHSLTLCTLALRAYWLDHGMFPDSLEELVPAYLPSIPIDFSCNQPVQYNKSIPAVYTGSDTNDGTYVLDPKHSQYRDQPFMILDWAKAKP